MTIHTGEKPYQCWYCEYATDRKTSLKSHCMRKHEMDEDEYNEKVKKVTGAGEVETTEVDI